MKFLDFFKKLFHRKPTPTKIGLALGSGGAKGMAHLGALKAFEEEKISFQVVTGTSIGSIIGAFYAKGYTVTDIREMIRTAGFYQLIPHLRPRMNMLPIERLLDRYFGESEFCDLKIPFACWATDEDSNEGVLLREGNLAKSCCASSAMPPFFSAVKIGERYLADGAFTNSVPADVARDMGADFVVGIDLATPKKENSSGVLSSVINKFIGEIPVKELPDARSRGYESADVMLVPDLEGHRATDLTSQAWEDMFEAGYTEAKRRMPEIKKLLRERGFRSI